MVARWGKIKSFPFKFDLQIWNNVMTAPINNIEIPESEKKRVRNYFNKGFTDWLKTKWEHNEKMAGLFTYCIYSHTFAREVMVYLSVYHDIEVVNERYYFQDLKWKIMIPEINSMFREASLHSFSTLKDQISLNQHNPIYNARTIDSQKIKAETDK
jgi:hypothetical protein